MHRDASRSGQPPACRHWAASWLPCPHDGGQRLVARADAPLSAFREQQQVTATPAQCCCACPAVTFQRLTSVQSLSSTTAIRSGAGKLVRSPPTPNTASRCALAGASQKISHLKVQRALQPPTVSHHHTQSSPTFRSLNADRHITEKKQKNPENHKKIPCDALRPLRQPLHRCRAIFLSRPPVASKRKAAYPPVRSLGLPQDL